MAGEFLPVLLGGDANVYGMARSFYEGYGVTSVALCCRALPAVRHSRLVSVAVQQPGLEQDKVFVKTLLEFAKTHPCIPLVLVPCADSYALLLARHAAALRRSYHFASPPPQTVLKLGVKQTFAKSCAAYGLQTPATLAVRAVPHSLPFPYPVVVKPADSTAFWHCRFQGRRKVFLAQNADELAHYLNAVAASSYPGAMLLQEYIPGGDDALRVVNAYCDGAGEITLFAAARCLLEERTPEGRGNYAALLAGVDCLDGATRRSLCEMLRQEHWHGFANFDLKYHAATGRAYLFELNPRQGRAAYYASAAGQNPAVALCSDVLDLPPTAPPQPQRAVLWHTAPLHAVRCATENKVLWRQAAACPKAPQLLSPAEGPARRLWYAARQLNYYRKLARYGG